MYNKIWTAHLQTDEDKQRFLNQLHGSRDVTDRLLDLIDAKTKELGSTERNIKVYDNPNWAYQQAHRNGYYTAMSSIKNLLTLDQEKK